jgi:hypothetical protein
MKVKDRRQKQSRKTYLRYILPVFIVPLIVSCLGFFVITSVRTIGKSIWTYCFKYTYLYVCIYVCTYLERIRLLSRSQTVSHVLLNIYIDSTSGTTTVSFTYIGVCVVTINGIPADFTNSDKIDCETLSTYAFMLLFLSSLIGYGGPFCWCFIYYPFFKAFPEVASPRRKKNLIVLGIAMLLVWTFITAIVLVPASVRLTVITVSHSCQC